MYYDVNFHQLFPLRNHINHLILAGNRAGLIHFIYGNCTRNNYPNYNCDQDRMAEIVSMLCNHHPVISQHPRHQFHNQTVAQVLHVFHVLGITNTYFHVITNRGVDNDRRIVINFTDFNADIDAILHALLNAPQHIQDNMYEFKVYINATQNGFLKDDKIVIYYRSGVVNPVTGFDATGQDIVNTIGAIHSGDNAFFPYYYDVPGHVGYGFGEEPLVHGASFSSIRSEAIADALMHNGFFPGDENTFERIVSDEYFNHYNIDRVRPYLNRANQGEEALNYLKKTINQKYRVEGNIKLMN